jgi:hypothetical protein
MSEESTLLDEAFDRTAVGGFELPNGFVNHGPMACEALAAMDHDADLGDWSRRFARVGGQRVDPVVPVRFDWSEALGAKSQLPEWIGYFERTIDAEGWQPVVGTWVPRLTPGLAVKLFHGTIRVAHAVRAIDALDTQSRRAELARALGYWAASFYPGQLAEAGRADHEGQDTRLAIVEAAAEGARRYLAQPDIFNLHGVTGAMAVALLAPHLSEDAARSGLAQVHAEHEALYRNVRPVSAGEERVAGVPDAELAESAAKSGDPHQVKLVEACRRGFAATKDPGFAAAAETVTGTGAEA